jgi:hypothetical protein
VRKSRAKVSGDLRIKSAGRIVPGVTVEPFPRHPFHEVWRQTVPPFRENLRPLVEQRPASDAFFTARQIGERRKDFLRRLRPKQVIERPEIVALDIGQHVRHVFFVLTGLPIPVILS